MKFIFTLVLLMLLCSVRGQEKSSKQEVAEHKKLIKTIYVDSYKKLYNLLKEEKVKPIKWAVLKKSFSKFAADKYIEEVTKVRKDWFVRVSKGCAYMSIELGKHQNALTYNKKSDAKRAMANYESAKKRLIDIMKQRKTEYAVKKR